MAKAKRPRDVNQRAKSIVDIATGENTDTTRPEKNAAAVALGSKGGTARAKSLTPEQRSEIAKKGAAKRWKKKGA